MQNCLNEPRFLQFVPEKIVCFSLCVDKTCVCEVYYDSLLNKDTQINNTDTLTRPVSYRIYSIKHCRLINATDGSKITMNKCHPQINHTHPMERRTKMTKKALGGGGGDSAYERDGDACWKF